MHKSPHLRTGRQVQAARTQAPSIPHTRKEPGALMNEDTHATFNLACLSLIYFIRDPQVSKSRLFICSPVLGLNAVDKEINPADKNVG